MQLRRVKYEDDDSSFRIEGGGRIASASDGTLVFPLGLAGDVGVAWLAQAFARCEDYDGGDLEAIFLSNSSADEFDPDASSRDVYVEYQEGLIAVQAGVPIGSGAAPKSVELARLFAPLLAKHRAVWRSSWISDEDFLSIHISAVLKPGRRSLLELYSLGVDVQDLLSALEGMTALTAQTARHLVSAGQARLLLGQPESSWLDAKGAPYKLATDGQKWEVAKDVVAFANGGRDALLILGVLTSKHVNGDVLSTLRPFPLAQMDVTALRAILRERIVPLIPDLDVGVAEVREGHGYGWIYIPEQAQELRPFLVAGAFNGMTFLGSHVSIPFRAGEDTAHLDASAVHSLLAAGRVALQIR